MCTVLYVYFITSVHFLKTRQDILLVLNEMFMLRLLFQRFFSTTFTTRRGAQLRVEMARMGTPVYLRRSAANERKAINDYFVETK